MHMYVSSFARTRVWASFAMCHNNEEPLPEEGDGSANSMSTLTKMTRS